MDAFAVAHVGSKNKFGEELRSMDEIQKAFDGICHQGSGGV